MKEFDPTILPEKQLLVYGVISHQPGLNANQIANLLMIKKSSVENSIKSLRKKNIIEYAGSKTNGGYSLNQNLYECTCFSATEDHLRTDIENAERPPKDHRKTTERK